MIKKTYGNVRDRVLKLAPEVTPVELLIEPLDSIEIGAWAAKAKGILGLPKKSLHFELPLHNTLGSQNARGAYADILTLLIEEIAPVLSNLQ